MSVQTSVSALSGTGANASHLRDHNARSFLTLLRTDGPTAGVTLAKRLGVSAQTASVILRSLETQGYVKKCEPVKGKVGKPLVPYDLDSNGAFAFGCRIGRRRTDIALVNFAGERIWDTAMHYPFPEPMAICAFVKDALEHVRDREICADVSRVVGIGVAAPFELWNWLEGLGASKEKADLWRDFRFEAAFAAFTDLPVHVANDVNFAANGELMFGMGDRLRDFAYFYIGAFVGGAVVLDGKVFHGAHGNAGAFGSIPTGDTGKPGHQLIAQASIYRLEQMLSDQAGSPANLRVNDQVWVQRRAAVDAWLEGAVPSLSKAIVGVAAVLDLPDFVVDGVFPAPVRALAVEKIRAAVGKIDQQGVNPVRIHEGRLGSGSGVLGAAYQPILNALLVEGSAIAPRTQASQ